MTHWSDVGDDLFWNDTAFAGASLPLSDPATVSDQRAVALGFFRHGLDLLRATSG